MSLSYVVEDNDSKVDYTRILAPQYDPEIVPSRKTREPDVAILQSHDGLRCRRASEKESPRVPRKFDYAQLYFNSSPADRPAPPPPASDYVNLGGSGTVTEEATAPSTTPEHTCTGSVAPQGLSVHVARAARGGSYVNLQVHRPGAVAHARSNSSCQLPHAPSPSPSSSPHPLSRWQSERLHPSTKPILGALQPPVRDYQNIRPSSSSSGARRCPSPSPVTAGGGGGGGMESGLRLSPHHHHHHHQEQQQQQQQGLVVARARSFQSPLPRSWDKPAPLPMQRRNPTTGQYSDTTTNTTTNTTTDTTTDTDATTTSDTTSTDTATAEMNTQRGHHGNHPPRRSVSGGGGGSWLGRSGSESVTPPPRQPWGVVVRRLPPRSRSEVRGRQQQHRKTHILDRPASEHRLSLTPDYQNLWYLEPESFSILEGYQHPDTTTARGRGFDVGGGGSSTDGCSSVYRGSLGSLYSVANSDYYDRLEPPSQSKDECAPSDITPSHVATDTPPPSSCGSLLSGPPVAKDHFRPMSTPPTSAQSPSRDEEPKRRSYQQAPPPLPKRSSAKAKSGSHLGLFKVQYLGQHPANRFTDEVDLCHRKIVSSVHFTAKEVFVYVTSSTLRLTPPHSDLLFAAFSAEHVLAVEASHKSDSVVGIVFKRSKAKCVCHVFDCRDRLTAKIFLKTVREALVSISEEDSLQLKSRAEEIERCSLLPSDLFGTVTYVGSCRISSDDIITKTIDSALSGGTLRPAHLHSVVLNLLVTQDRRGGVLEVIQSDSSSPMYSWHVCDVEMVGCRVADRRYVGVHLLEDQPHLHILHFGGAGGGVAFLAVLRDKFGVSIDEGEFVSPRRTPSCKGAELGPPRGREPWQRPPTVSKKLSFKKLICAIAK